MGNSRRGFRRASDWRFRHAAARTAHGRAQCGHDVPPCRVHLICSAWPLHDDDVPLGSGVLRQRYDV